MCIRDSGKLIDGDVIEIAIDLPSTKGEINLVGHGEQIKDADWGRAELSNRQTNPACKPVDGLPTDTMLWSLLQSISGGTWGGCVYDLQSIQRSLLLASDST